MSLRPVSLRPAGLRTAGLRAAGLRAVSVRTAAVAGLARARRSWRILLASGGLLLVLGTLAAAIALSQRESRSQILANLNLRATGSATFASTFVSQQAERERDAAQQLLSGASVPPQRLGLVTTALGSRAALLLDSGGRLLDSIPVNAPLLGRGLAGRFPRLAQAERGATVVSDVITSAPRVGSVVGIVVPFSTPSGRRVLGAAYAPSGSALQALVDHTISYPRHEVFLLDADGRLLAASPRSAAFTLDQADPALASAAERASHGTLTVGGKASTFVSAPVSGSSWRILIAVPDSRLYASIDGLTEAVPWLVLALVSLLGVLLVSLFARSLADRSRLASVSRRLHELARTDPLTGLLNRRGLSDHLSRVVAHARRKGEPVSALMVDLDRFKETNDRFGHEAGDQVLCALADCMREVFRGEDVYGRWGGDEFLAVLPAADAQRARAAAARLRQSAAEVALDDVGLVRGVPMSVGVATTEHGDVARLLRDADAALYRVKHGNRQPAVIARRAAAAPGGRASRTS